MATTVQQNISRKILEQPNEITRPRTIICIMVAHSSVTLRKTQA